MSWQRAGDLTGLGWSLGSGGVKLFFPGTCCSHLMEKLKVGVELSRC